MPHRLACVTHEDVRFDGVEIIKPPREFEEVRIPTWGEHRPQCLRRLVMFRPDAAKWFGDWIICMDTDAVISGPLDPLFTDHDFRIFKGTAPNRPYNGSLFMLRAGARAEVYADFTPERAADAGKQFVGSDQAWIAQRLGPDEPTWDARDGVSWWQGRADDNARVTFFPGGLKPWEMDDPFVAEHYRRGPGRRGLILGRGRSVWDDAEAALSGARYDGVIALREPAQHWPGDIEAVAENEAHAERLAAMLGFSEWTFCGRAMV